MGILSAIQEYIATLGPGVLRINFLFIKPAYDALMEILFTMGIYFPSFTYMGVRVNFAICDNTEQFKDLPFNPIFNS
jgi:hypothetical protein